MGSNAAALLACAWLAMCCPAFADAPAESEKNSPSTNIEGWNLQFSMYTYHWDPEPEHNNHQRMISLEARMASNWVVGLSVFDNSFDQPSQLLYAGKIWPLLDSPHWYAKLVGGFIHGYKEPYEDKIPLNGLGVAPVILPSLGFRLRNLMVESHFAGLAAVTVTAGFRF